LREASGDGANEEETAFNLQAETFVSDAAVSSCAICPLGRLTRVRCPFTPVQRPAQAIICQEGEYHPAVYWIRDGLVLLGTVEGGGFERSLTFRGPRNLLCVEALRHEASAFEVRALSLVKLCSSSASELLVAIASDGSVAHALVDLLLAELKNRWGDEQWRWGSSLSRVAHFVLAYGADPSVLPYFQKQIAAALLGMRPETFSRCIRQLTSAEVIGKDWRHLAILDHRRLEKLAGAHSRSVQPGDKRRH